MGSEVNGILAAAHELKAPLGLMRQLALSLDIVPDRASQSRVVAQMVDVSERALAQVNDLIKIAHLEDGLFTMEPVSVRGVCESVSSELKQIFAYEQKNLRMIYKNRQKLVIANSELLNSVIFNFCASALHHSEANMVSSVTISDKDDCVKIDVRDYGPALPWRTWREIKYGKIPEPTMIAMRPGSSNLGLYIAARFAEYMHAEFGAVRHRDGTSFYVKMPISKQACLF